MFSCLRRCYGGFNFSLYLRRWNWPRPHSSSSPSPPPPPSPSVNYLHSIPHQSFLLIFFFFTRLLSPTVLPMMIIPNFITQFLHSNSSTILSMFSVKEDRCLKLFITVDWVGNGTSLMPGTTTPSSSANELAPLAALPPPPGNAVQILLRELSLINPLSPYTAIGSGGFNLLEQLLVRMSHTQQVQPGRRVLLRSKS